MKQIRHIQINELAIPIEMIPENRRSARAAFGKSAILLRFPKRSTQAEIEKHYQWAVNWLQDLFVKKPKVFERYRPLRYSSGKTISTAYKEYSVSLNKAKRKTLGGKLRGEEILISVPHDLASHHSKIGNLVSRVIAKDQISWIESKVHALNNEHFNENVKKVSLRYSKTRWGSCSHNGNISLSTRVLLAPEHIIDHIIVHELAHLKEMNHSPAFWNWVRKAEPDHDENDRWLKKFGYQLKF